MRQICAIIGVGSDKSLNLFALKTFLMTWEKKEKILYNIIMLKDNELDYCDECDYCLENKKCYKESKDSLKKFIKELEKSDIIIMASPVYANNISARLLNFINRSKYLVKTQQLSKKYGVILITTNATGADFAKWYLSSLFKVLGISLIKTITLYDLEILSHSIIESKLTEVVNDVIIKLQ